ncbi:MAG TPA: ABC transporter permease [Thermoanaerobaculia bacterium]|nr:ABC transporter permease [Thermoanaerobaculia bacterium]
MGIAQDFRFAARLLRKSPGFAAVSIAVLALGIGGNAAIFTLVNRVMLRPLPYPEPERLMALSLTASGRGMKNLAASDALPWSFPKFRMLREIDRDFERLAAFGEDALNLAGTGEPERVRVEYASGDYFPMLGVRAQAGRLLSPTDDSAGAAPAALLADGLARRRFGSPAAAVGRIVSLNGIPVTVVGVAAPGFSGLGGAAALWVPLALAPRLLYPSALAEAGDHWLDVVGRRRAGVTDSAALAEISAAGLRIAEAFPVPARFNDGSVWGARAVPLGEARKDPWVRRALTILLAAIGAVLLLACGNLAALLVARGAARRHEIAVRLSLGATAGRIRRQLLAESLLLAGAGGALGLEIALWGSRALVAFAPSRPGETGLSAGELLDLSRAAVDLRVVAFTAALALATGVLFGLVPAWRASRGMPGEFLRDSSARGSRRFGKGRSAVVAAEIGLALTLVLGAGLLARSFGALSRVPLGFEPAHVIAFSIKPPETALDEKSTPPFHAALLARISAIPGVRDAGIDLCAPLSGRCNRTGIRQLDGARHAPGTLPPIGIHFVSTGYFSTLSIPLRAGRPFTAADRAGAPRVVIVNETAARRLWPDGRAVGRRIGLGQGGFEDGEQAEVVGVVADVRYGGVDAPPTLDAYIPDLQYAFGASTIFVRFTGNPAGAVPALRAAVRSVAPDLPIDDVRTLGARVADALSSARFAAALLGGFALFATALAALGIYGLLAQAASERSREIGIRLALGATPRTVLAMMLRWSAAVTAAGIAGGAILFALVSRTLGALLFGVRPGDPSTVAVVGGFVAAVAIGASLLPAARAAKTDPVRALRDE